MAAVERAPERMESYSVVPGRDEHGTPIFSVLVKRTYDLRSGLPAERAEADSPLRAIDEYYDRGDPEWATVQHEADLVPFKIATDLVVIGKAHAPEGRPTRQLEVAVRIGERQKTIRVIGDRRCSHKDDGPPVFTEPAEFTEMEIRYERAYGGWDRLSNPDLPFVYPRNSMGKGLALGNTHELIEGLELPNLEDPEDLLSPERLVLGEPTHWNRQPLPQGLGWFQRTWYPRCSFVGSVPGFVAPDEVMREEILGHVPKQQIALARQLKLPSFDLRFANGASLGLAIPYLSGGERIYLKNLSRQELLDVVLPQDAPRLMLDIGLGENELEPVLQTVCLRPEEMQADLVWRGSHEYPGVEWLPEMKRMNVEVA